MRNNKFMRLFHYDMIIGFRQNWLKLLAGLFLLIFICGVTMVYLGENHGGVMYLADILKGAQEYIAAGSSEFTLPVVWLILHLYILFIVCTFPMNDLKGFGKNILLFCADRKKWWYSKCLWIVTTVTGFILVLWIVMLALSGLSGNGFLGKVAGADELLGLNINTHNIAYMFLLPLVVLIALGLVQSLLSLVTNPVLGYMASIVLLCASVYWKTPWLIGNYSMLLRLSPFTHGGIPVWSGLILCSIVGVVCWLGGAVVIKKHDIIN
ncbi:hypothetical protein LJC56_09365 [Christensenellaceae bacterium OttesenSCG-928-K19]|nr:hypothetical protein [Christensenellaceae bacterium OttesenSCG-928-K19]